MKNLSLIASIVSLIIAFSSCSKDNVTPSKSTSTSGTASTGTTSAAPIIVTNLQGNWTVISDSTYWAGEKPKYLVSAYKGISDDSFNFAADGNLYIKEDGNSNTTTYAVDDKYNVTVIYPDGNHFDAAPGFSLIAGDQMTPIAVYFGQNNINKNTLTLVGGVATPGGVSSRVITLKR
jgi:hypothetical protein